MPNCPGCASALRTEKREGGLFFLCDQCGGRAATVPQVRRAVGERFARVLLHEILRASTVTPRKCPFCELPMKEFQNLETGLILDTCKACSAVWFDAREFEQACEREKDTAGISQPRSPRQRSLVGDSGSDETLTAEVLRSIANFLCLPF